MDYGITAVLVPCHRMDRLSSGDAGATFDRWNRDVAAGRTDPTQMSGSERRLQAIEQALSRLACDSGVDMPMILSTCLVADVGNLEDLPIPPPCDPAALEPPGTKLLFTTHEVDPTPESPAGTVNLVTQRDLEVRAALIAHLREMGYLNGSVADGSFVPIVVTATMHDDTVQARDQHSRFHDAVQRLVMFVDQEVEADLHDPAGPIKSAPGYKGLPRPDPASTVFSSPKRYLGAEGLERFHRALVENRLLDPGMPLDELLAELDRDWAAQMGWRPEEPRDDDYLPTGHRLK
jgi:hypothetical protein